MRARLSLLPLAAALLGPVSSTAAQAVDRTDTPRRGTLRVSFDPTTMTWERNFTPTGRQGIGAGLSGDSAATQLPAVAMIQQDTRALTGIAGYVASIGHDLLAVRAERRVMPIGLEYGISDRLSVGVMVPIVRVYVREGYTLHPPGSNVGFGPRTSADSARYLTFFANLQTALTLLSDSIKAGAFGCPASPACARAQAIDTLWQTMSQTLTHAVFGVPDSVAHYLPLAGSDAGRAITALVTGLQRALADTFHISAFNKDTLLLPATAIVDPADIAALYAARADSLALAPFGATPRRLRFFAGDVEVQAKMRLLESDDAALAAAFVVRLPTGHQESPNDPFDISTGDHQTDLEGRLTGEFTLLNRIWLNASVRAARQLPGTRARRVGPADNPFLPLSTLAPRLRWDPGDFVAIDVAPMFRFNPRFAVGVTASYYAQGQDKYGFFNPQDSVALAMQIGAPANVSVLDAGTAIRQTRLGFALTYTGPRLEGGLSVQQTVSGAGGLVPDQTVFRIVIRQAILLF